MFEPDLASFSCGTSERSPNPLGICAKNLIRCTFMIGTVMTSDFKSIDLKSMSSDELYLLHLEMVDVLTAKLAAKRNELEERLQQLKPASDDQAAVEIAPALSHR